MNIILECILFVFDILLSIFVSWFRFFLPPASKSVTGEKVLITGGASGLGRLLAIEFFKRGAIVVIWDKDEDGSKETVRLAKEVGGGGEIYFYTCELSVNENIYKAAQLVKQEVGNIDILVNNAGTVAGLSFLECSDEDLENTNQVNLMAQQRAVKCFLPSMLERNHGHIVCISSALGLGGISGLTDYTTSKFGIIGFLETLNLEIRFGGYDGVHTTVVCPYHTKTGMFKGCKIRFRGPLDAIEPEMVVHRTMQAILTNQYQVFIPRIVYFVALSKLFLPVDAMLKIQRFTGVDTFMDGYVGRKAGVNGNHNKKSQ